MTNTPQGSSAPDHGQPTPGPADGQLGNRYGTAAYDPQRSFEQGKPDKVSTLHRMTIASLAIWLISLIPSALMTLSPDYEERLRQTYVDGGMSQEMADQAASSAGVLGIATLGVMLVLSLIPYILVLIGVPKGKNWARILGIVFCIIGIVFTAFGVVTSLGTLGDGGAMAIVGLLLSLLFLVVNIYWLVLAFNGRVAAWFKDRR